MVRDEDVEALRKGTFSRDCLAMELIRPTGREPKRFAGPGVFRQTPERRLEFTVYSTEGAPAGDFLADIEGTMPGVLIADHEYYTLRATDWTGAVWESDRILPDPSFGPGGTVVRGNLNAIRSSEEYPGSRDLQGISGRIFGDFELPANLRTRETKAIGERETWSSFSWRGLKLESVGATVMAMPDPGILTVAVQSDTPLPPRFETRVLETIQFLLGRSLSWDIVEMVSGGTRRTTISGHPTPTGPTHAWAPLAVVHARDAAGTEAFCRLFDAYLRYIVPFSEDRWHPITVDLVVASSALASSVQAHVLTLSVAVEGVLRNAFASTGEPPDALKADVERAIDELTRMGGWSPEFVRRFQGALGAIKGVRAGDRLRELTRRAAIDDVNVQAWEKLRNLSAHGDDIFKLDHQELLDLRMHVLVLLHQLVFFAIGYRGLYTDYSTNRWPRAEYVPREPSVS